MARKYTRDADGKFASGGSSKGAKSMPSSGSKAQKSLPAGSASAKAATPKSAKASAGAKAKPSRGDNLTKRIQLHDVVGMERRRVWQDRTIDADTKAKKLRKLRAIHRAEAKKYPVFGKL